MKSTRDGGELSSEVLMWRMWWSLAISSHFLSIWCEYAHFIVMISCTYESKQSKACEEWGWMRSSYMMCLLWVLHLPYETSCLPPCLWACHSNGGKALPQSIADSLTEFGMTIDENRPKQSMVSRRGQSDCWISLDRLRTGSYRRY